MIKIRSYIASILGIALLLSFHAFTGFWGCAGDITGYHPDKIGKLECTTPVKNCTKKNGPLHITTLSSPSTAGLPSDCYKDFYESSHDYGPNQADPVSGLGVSDQIYCGEADWVIYEVTLGDVKGAHWLGLPHGDNTKTGSSYLEFKVLEATQGLYVAYDSRAKSLPTWLKTNFDKMTINNKDPHYIETTMSTISGGEMVRLDLYRRKKAPAENETVTLGANLGNQAGEVSWTDPAMSGERSAMYMVIVDPLEEVDCEETTPWQDKDYERNYHDIPPTYDDIVEGAKQDCDRFIQKMENEYSIKLQCGDPDCPYPKPIPGADDEITERATGLTVRPVGYPLSSEIEFNPSLYTSNAQVSIAGESYTRNVTGTLHFEYVLDDFEQLMTMKVYSMLLKVDPINTEIGNFADITVDLLAPVPADCKDSNPPYAQPCTWYQIADTNPPNATSETNRKFITSIAAKKGDDILLYVAQNANELDIKIDHTNRKFTIAGGPLTTQIPVDGDNYELSVSINLTGRFLNFAPTARGIESTRYVECAFKRFDRPGEPGYSANGDEIVLNGATSFEVYGDPIPHSAYRWYEDYSLVTEREFLPPEPIKVIEEGQMGFGVHDISLVIRDDRGISDIDTFQVAVRDTKPPVLQVPTDVMVLQQRPGLPVKINLGQAWGYDICSQEVMITNDAPQDSWFFPGVTPVVWMADDGRGHTTTGTQHVKVFKFPSPLDLQNRMRELYNIIQQISVSVSKSAYAAKACGAADRCVVSMADLSETVDQAGNLLAETVLPEEGRAFQNTAVDKLRQVSALLAESDELVGRSAGVPDQRGQLRGRAAEIAQGSLSELHEAANVIRELMEII